MIRPKEIRAFLLRLARNYGALIGVLFLTGYVLLVILGPTLSRHSPYEQSLQLSLRPGFWGDNYVSTYYLGTDLHGRDILSRLLYGARVTIFMGAASVAASTIVGLVLGIIAGYFGGLIDNVVVVVTDAMMSFPTILLAIILIAIFGTGLDKAIIAVAFVYTPRMLRVARGATIGIRSLDYVLAARAVGASSIGIQVRHIFPNVLAPVMVQVTFSMSQAITTIAGLGFLGLGAQPPLPEWGSMLSEALRYLMAQIWWYPLFPGILITGVVLGFNLLGDGLRDALDPKLRRI